MPSVPAGTDPDAPPACLLAEWSFVDALRDAQWAAGVELDFGADVDPHFAPPVDPARLADHELVDRLVALEAVKARADAAQVRVLAALDAADDTPEHFVVEDVRLALRLSRVAAEARVATARMLVDCLPATLAALGSGTITARHADAVCDAAQRVEPADRSRLEAMVLPRAGCQTRAELTRSLNRAVLRVDPDGAERRHRRAAADRSVVKYPELDAMAALVFRGPAPDVATVYARIDAAAHLLPADDPRGMDQKRADVFIDAVLAGLPVDGLPHRHGRAPTAEVTVALSTLLGADDEPADLAGYGPVPAAVAREMAGAADASWRRLITDPVTGTLLDYGRSTYRPPARLRDYILARDRVCAAPGCAIPARSGDVDHIQPWDDGGPTSAGNLAALCGRHHDAKTKNHLTYQRDPEGGYTWTTRTGHAYRTPPPGRADPPEPDAQPD